MNNKKIAGYELVEKLQSENLFFKPLVLYSMQLEPARDRRRPDAAIEVGLTGFPERYRFIVEAKSQSTPLAVQSAIAQARSYAQDDEYPMILVPYLSPERLSDLEREQVSGIDLCGNGFITIPNRYYYFRSGQPNQYRESRTLNNPYSGRSSLVARMLLSQREWPSLKELVAAIENAGARLSVSQASKAINALRDDLVIRKQGNIIKLEEPLRLLDRLGNAWSNPKIRSRKSLRLPPEGDWAKALSGDVKLCWAVTGASSVTRYAAFSQAGPVRIAVSDMDMTVSLLDAKHEPVANFADIELASSEEPGFYFQNEVDEKGIRWASRLQTWLELQAGDARQQEAAREIRQQILTDVTP